MITAFSFAAGELRPAAAVRPGEDAHWLDVAAPTDEECALLEKDYGIAREYIHAPLDPNERPRCEVSAHELFVLVRAPVKRKAHKRSPFATAPLALIVTPRMLITICPERNISQKLLAGNIRGRGGRISPRLALSLLLRVSSVFIEHLREIDTRVELIEQSLHASMRNEELVQMLRIEKSLIYFLTALKGNHAVMEKLRTTPGPELTAEEKDLLDDVLIENKQATDMAEIYTQILGSMGDAFGTMVSNNLNKVMKFLTGMTIVCMIPSIIGGIYGMNVALPFAESPYAFAGLIALCVSLAGVVGYFFRKWGWM